MKTLNVLIITLCLFTLKWGGNDILYAQSQFQLAIGGGSNDYARSIVQTPDGSYTVAGSSGSFPPGLQDFYIVKLYPNSTLQWTKSVGQQNISEYPKSIISTTDGGYVVAGYRDLGVLRSDAYILKLDAGGTLLWNKTINRGEFNQINSVIQTTLGGYAFAGFISGVDMYIGKLDNNANIQWCKAVSVRDTTYEAANTIIQTTDGGFVVAGETNYFNSYNDFCIIKMDATGTLQWARIVGGTNHDNAYSIIQTTDGGYVAAGVTSSFGAGSKDMYIVKISASGTLQWTRTVGGSFDDIAYSVIQTTDGGYVIAGSTNSFVTGVNDIYIVKLNSSGLLQWSKTIGGTTHDAAYSIIRTADGGYVVAGYTWSFGAGNADMYIVKFDANVNTCGNTTTPPSVSGTGGTIDSPTPIVSNPTLTITTPTPITNSGGIHVTLCYVGIQPVSNEIPKQFSLFQNYPNPFNPITKIKFAVPPSPRGEGLGVRLIIYDALGREVQTLVNESLQPGTYEVEWPAPSGDRSNFSSGVYYYTLSSGDYFETKRMVLIK